MVVGDAARADKADSDRHSDLLLPEKFNGGQGVIQRGGAAVKLMAGQERQGRRGRLTRKIGIVAAGRAANTASLIAIYALVARAWTAEECGLFMAVWVVGNALIPVFLLGLPTSLLYFFPRRREPRLLVGQVLLCSASSGLALAGCLWLWGPQLADVLVQEGGDSEQVAAYLLLFLPYLFAVIAAGGAETPWWPRTASTTWLGCNWLWAAR